MHQARAGEKQEVKIYILVFALKESGFIFHNKISCQSFVFHFFVMHTMAEKSRKGLVVVQKGILGNRKPAPKKLLASESDK